MWGGVSLFWFAFPSGLETPRDKGRQRSLACCIPWVFRESTTMTSNSEHLFMCILDICLSSLKKCLKSFAHFWMGFWGFLLLSCRIYSFCILTLVRYTICKYFLPFCRSFNFLDSVLGAQKFLIFMSSLALSTFPFVTSAFGVISKKSLPNWVSWSFSYMFSS